MTKTASSLIAAGMALALFAGWVFATWLLEGRIGTFLRPEAAVDRAVYAIVANLLIGTVIAMAVLRLLIRRGCVTRDASGFGPSTPSVARLAVAVALGVALYLVQGAPTLNAIVLTNVFAQVLVTSAAEVIVCWAVVGAASEALLRPSGRAAAFFGAGVVASVLFGLYHFAHSPPFNTFGMVALLTAVGMATSAFFFIARDAYATIVFHNFLGVFGVIRALDASGRLSALSELQLPLMIMALAMIAVLALTDRLLLRRATDDLDAAKT